MRPSHAIVLALVVGPFAGCVDTTGSSSASPSSPGGGSGTTYIEDSDPLSLQWVAPATASDAQAGAPLDLVVSTQNEAAHVMHFVVDGAEVAACDDSDPSMDCHDGDLWRWTVVAPDVGHHTASVWFVDAGGQNVTVTTDLDVQPALDDLGGGAVEGEDGPDPYADQLVDEGNSELVQAITSARGSLDSNSPQHNVCNGIDWSLENQRVLFSRLRLDGSLHELDRCRARFGTIVEQYADLYHVSRGSVFAALAAYGNCGATPEWTHNLVSGSTCHALNPAIAPADCQARMLSDSDFAIHTAVRYLAQTRSVHHRDPPLVAAVLERGAVRCSRANRWHIASGYNWINRFVGAYNAYRTSETRNHHPPRCTRRVTVTVAQYDGMGQPGDPGVPEDNGCWVVERVAKENPEWEICNYDGTVYHASRATHWAYDDTNLSHSGSRESTLIDHCEHRAWSWGYVYMANRGGGWPRRVSNASRYFAEIYSSDNTIDDQYNQWNANRDAGEPMINLVPGASPNALYAATRRLCTEVGHGGHLGLYVHGVSLEGGRLAGVVRALNDCTR